ncbi:MAG: hypothetical protein JSR76_01760 [Verrucomicrobia bacterium]|nr:hypothetical protein [Verrucomicrobiota bacterium]
MQHFSRYLALPLSLFALSLNASSIVPYCQQPTQESDKGKAEDKQAATQAPAKVSTPQPAVSSKIQPPVSSYSAANKDLVPPCTKPQPPLCPKRPYPAFVISGTYELLKMAQEGLGFAIATTTSTDFAISSASVTNPKAPWRSGFGINFGALTPTDWNIDIGYTLLYNKNNSTQIISTPAPPLTSVAFLWNSVFNRLDFTLSKGCNPYNCLPLSPFVGILGAWDSQTFKATYNTDTASDFWHLKQNWWAIGPYVGGDFNFFFVKNFLFLLQSGLSVNLSRFNTNRDLERVPDTADPTVVEEVQVSDSYWALRTMFDFTLGFRFQVDWDVDKPFFIQIDWRGQIWPDHLFLFNYSYAAPDITPASPILSNSNFSMQGLGVTAGITF